MVRVLGCLVWLAYPAWGGTETFDTTGLGSSWVAAGVFTGQENIVWTYANARGTPTIYSDNPSITLRGSSTAANKGWLQSSTITGGLSRISVVFKQELTAPADFNFLANDVIVGNYRSSGVSGEIAHVSFDVVPPTNQVPFTNEFILTVSNRLATGGSGALDDLTWEPFRLFVRLNRTGTVNVFAEQEFDVVAELFSVGQEIISGWEVPEAFAGTTSDTNDLHLTLTPAPADIGQTFEFKYLAMEEGTGAVAQASFQIVVEEAPSHRWIDFETVSFNYNTNEGVVTNLNGMDWKFVNVRTSDSTDRKIGTRSARFRHSSAAQPAIMESLSPFEGIGTISLHYAYYGATSRVVCFETQIRAENGEEWYPLENGSFDVDGHDDITNSIFSVDVQDSGPVYFRLITTAQFGQIANVDDIRIREFGDTLPRLAWTGTTNIAVGRENIVDVHLVNAEFIARTWDYALTPSNAHASFEITTEEQLRFRWGPESTNDWGEYTLAATAWIETQAYPTSLTLRVVSPPEFALAPVATLLDVGDIVDVWVTNVVLHAGGTNWTTSWRVVPPFVNTHSVSNKSRFRIAAGTVAEDIGEHQIHAIMTDLATGVQTTQTVVLTVGTTPVEETYVILEFEKDSHLVVSGKSGRVFMPFGLTNLMLSPAQSNWVWSGAPVTNLDGSDVLLNLPKPQKLPSPAPLMFFYGVQVKPTP